MYAERVLSGMRPTGSLHLGHYHGVLKNWIKLQHEYPCLFFVADWHALTTQYDDPRGIEGATWDMIIDWLAAGVDPEKAALFIQSQVPEHAELHLLFSMMTPLGWLERVPTYKEQIEKLREKDLSTYGFLGYPLLQAADILIYRAQHVPVGEDQVPHLEMTREIARRFNYLYGREPDFEEKAQEAVKKLGSKLAKQYIELRNRFQEQGEEEAIEQAHALLDESKNLTLADRERLFGYLEGSRKIILVEPQAMLTENSRMPGLDGQKMSKSYGNTIPFTSRKMDIISRINQTSLEVKGNTDLFALFYILPIAYAVLLMRFLVFAQAGDSTLVTVFTSIVIRYSQQLQNSMNAMSFLISIVICVGTGVLINHLKNEQHFC